MSDNERYSHADFSTQDISKLCPALHLNTLLIITIEHTVRRPVVLRWYLTSTIQTIAVLMALDSLDQDRARSFMRECDTALKRFPFRLLPHTSCWSPNCDCSMTCEWCGYNRCYVRSFPSGWPRTQPRSTNQSMLCAMLTTILCIGPTSSPSRAGATRTGQALGCWRDGSHIGSQVGAADAPAARHSAGPRVCRQRLVHA